MIFFISKLPQKILSEVALCGPQGLALSCKLDCEYFTLSKCIWILQIKWLLTRKLCFWIYP